MPAAITRVGDADTGLVHVWWVISFPKIYTLHSSQLELTCYFLFYLTSKLQQQQT